MTYLLVYLASRIVRPKFFDRMAEVNSLNSFNHSMTYNNFRNETLPFLLQRETGCDVSGSSQDGSET